MREVNNNSHIDAYQPFSSNQMTSGDNSNVTPAATNGFVRAYRIIVETFSEESEESEEMEVDKEDKTCIQYWQSNGQRLDR